MSSLLSPPAPARLRVPEPRVPGPWQRLRRYGSLATALVLRQAAEALRRLRSLGLRALARLRMPRGARNLCLGSGAAPLAGWTNVDLEGSPELRLDLRDRLPFPTASAHRIYSEHLIEHLELEDGLRLLRECRRLLAPGGVLRIATPDLEALVDAYREDWRAQDWVQWPCHRFLDSAARMLNMAFRAWGHRHLYDAEELELRLREAGFTELQRCALGASEHPELGGLETRSDSKLIFEARVPEEMPE